MTIAEKASAMTSVHMPKDVKQMLTPTTLG